MSVPFLFLSVGAFFSFRIAVILLLCITLTYQMFPLLVKAYLINLCLAFISNVSETDNCMPCVLFLLAHPNCSFDVLSCKDVRLHLLVLSVDWQTLTICGIALIRVLCGAKWLGHYRL